MTRQPVQHSSFVIERDLPAGPAHAFRFFSEAALKERWTGCHPDWSVIEDSFDFRVGGGESKVWRTGEGVVQTMRAHYLDIVQGERIIYAYEMTFRERRVSASLVTVEFAPSGAKTRMTFTEQLAFLAGGDADVRRQGTEWGFDRLAEAISADVLGDTPAAGAG